MVVVVELVGAEGAAAAGYDELDLAASCLCRRLDMGTLAEVPEEVPVQAGTFVEEVGSSLGTELDEGESP